MDDVWKEIQGFPGYEVSSEGHIRRRVNNKLLPRKPSIAGRGYLAVWFRWGNRKVIRYVHRLVLVAFVGPCPEGMECRHLDGNPLNNRLNNLAWGTHVENVADTIRMGRWKPVPPTRGERRHHAKLTPDKVRDMRLRHASGESIHSLSRAFSVSRPNVKSVLTRATWAHVS